MSRFHIPKVEVKKPSAEDPISSAEAALIVSLLVREHERLSNWIERTGIEKRADRALERVEGVRLLIEKVKRMVKE